LTSVILYNRVRERQGVKMDALSQFAEWFPDIITPVLVERDEEKARLQEAVSRLQEAEARLQEAVARLQEAKASRQEAEAKLQDAKASRQEAEAKLQEVEALLHAERQSVRQRVCEKV